MKKILLASVVTLALGAVPASAADMAARPYTKAPVMAVDPGYNWSGFYVGLNGGGAWGREDNTFVGNGVFTAPGAFPLTSAFITANQQDSRQGRFTGGVQAGYNWQMANWLIGVEGDINYIERKNYGFASVGVVPGTATTVVSTSSTPEWFATLRGRAGFLVAPTFLLYGTGGVAFTENRGNQNIVVTTVGTPGFFTNNNNSDTRIGWTAGAGGEWGFAPNWSAKVEYLHVQFERQSDNVLFTGPNAVGLAGAAATISRRQELDIVRAGINYRFGGPVLARY
jgi:outer membrane immunogenic protein